MWFIAYSKNKTVKVECFEKIALEEIYSKEQFI